MTSASTSRSAHSSTHDDVAGPLDVSASLDALRERAQARLGVATRPALFEAVLRGERTVALCFAGQGSQYFDELVELWAGGGAPRALLEPAFAALADEATQLDPLDVPRLRNGLDVHSWLEGRRPDDETLASAAVSVPLVLLTQLARVEQLLEAGLQELFALPAERAPLVVGHSQGLLGGLALARSWGQPAKERAWRTAPLARVALRLGCAMHDHQLAAAPAPATRQSLEDTGAAPACMAAVGGLSIDELRAFIERVDGSIAIALTSAPTHHTVAGAPAALEALREALVSEARALTENKKRGLHAGRVPEARFSWLPVSGPFHTAHLQASCERLLGDVARLALAPQQEALALTVLDAATGLPLVDSADALPSVLRSIMVQPGSFRASLATLLASGVDTILDVGPGEEVGRLAASAVRGRGVGVLSVAAIKHRTALLDERRAPVLPAPWASFAPCAVDDGSGPRLENRFTRATGRPPFIVPGMTPTTVEAPLVMAAANAGFVAELAGGGQVTERHLRARLDELRLGLRPGEGIVFNALFLDPYLWGLHLGKERLIFKLRAEGYPILGVTISAGLPPLEDAVAMLDELCAHGMTLNALKPGNDAQLDEVIAIAKARPERTLFVHLEGGKAGGHHSWEDLDDLLLRHYAKLRAQENIVLCVGGGIGTEEQASSYLFGSWSEVYERAPMPVDAVFLGTRLMATSEACTSQAVKAALVQASGDPARWPVGDAAVGGVRSGKSSLDAPIYYLDNAAARAGRLLDDVAGDAAKVSARRAEIIAALANTAKPYFGEVAHMTPAEVLDRLVALTAVGNGAPLEDGVWPDPSWRARFVLLARRFEARFASNGQLLQPSLVTESAAQEPRALVEQLTRRAPALTTALMHPEDARFFLELCRRPGKPVPFVPVIDAEVRRWFKSDSLWQSHEARFDAQAVLTLPGPAALAAIERVDEPVAEVLGSFEQAALRRALAKGVTTVTRAAALSRACACPFAVDEAGWWQPSPLGHLQGKPGAQIAWQDDALVASVTLPTGLTLDLGLSFVEDRHGGHLRVNRAAFLRACQDFYGHALFGEPVTPVSLFDVAREPVEVSATRIHAFRAATFDDNAPCAALPLAFPLAWRAIYRALAGADADVLRLVHESNEVEGSGFVVGDRLTAAARVTQVQDQPGGRRITVESKLTDANAVQRARIISRFFIRQSVGVEGVRREDREVSARLAADAGALAFLNSVPGVRLDAAACLDGELELNARVTERGAAGRLLSNGAVVGSVALDPPAFDALLEVLVKRAPRAVVTGRLGVKRSRAPRSMQAYADASGDKNPLHTQESIAALAGFDAPIVHGMWTASFAAHRIARLAADGDASRVTRLAARFLAPVARGAPLTVAIEAVARSRGALEVRALVEADGVVCAEVDARVAPASTAYVFPGQGVQHAGMGMTTMAQSPAARAVWQEADQACRARHGFSLLQVVTDNPSELWVQSERLVHPEGVLFLTQFTQVALAVMAVAEVAALREQGAFVEDARFAGHSLGEYSALAAVAGVMPLSAVVDVVYRRGLTMDRLVPRDQQGRSPYGMVALRPNLAGLDERAALAVVNEVARVTELPLFVVNHNLRGRQYAVTGDVRALAALKERLAPSDGARPAVVEIPGVDVPFHSPLLRDGVDAFRATLDAALPERIEASALIDRYLPNLTGTTFRLEPAFLREVVEASGSARVAALLGSFSDVVKDPDALARALLIEVLAYQFASPVRWIDIQDALLTGPAATAVLVEVGPTQGPVLAGMARATLEAARRPHSVRVLHAGADREALLGVMQVESDAAPAPFVPPAPVALEAARDGLAQAPASTTPPTVVSPAPVPAAVSALPSAAPAANDTALPEAGSVAEDGFFTLLCLLAKKERSDIDPARSLDALLGGNSARRNQVLAELAAEGGGRSVDNAHELPLRKLASAFAKTSKQEGPGPVLRPLREQALARLLGGAGLDVARLHELFEREWALSRGHRELLLNRLALSARSQAPATNRAQAVALLERAVAGYAAELGVHIARVAERPAATAVDSAALDELEARLLGKHGALADAARAILQHVDAAALSPHAAGKHAGVTSAALDAAGPEERRNAQRNAQLDEVEHDQAYRDAVAPIFDERRHVAFTSAWAWVRRDLLDRSIPRDQVELRAAPGGRFALQTALVTGAGEGSIARALVARLLKEGARVVVTTSRRSPEVVRSFKALYQEHARIGAELHVVLANQGSFADIDALAAWLAQPKKERVGSTERVIKGQWIPDLVVPFGAIAETADASSMGPRSLAMFRVLVLGVERLVARCAELAQRHGAPGRRAHVLLPLSPNHGTFGGDGAYGECKAALEALLHKQRSEARSWGAGASMVGARIGWVRGTGLMHKNDGAASFLESRGLRTFRADQMAELLLAYASEEARERAASQPLLVDLTGGLGEVEDLAELLGEHRAREESKRRVEARQQELRGAFDAALSVNDAQANSANAAPQVPPPLVAPLARPTLAVPVPTDAQLSSLPQLDHLELHEVAVIVGIGEVGPWGSARTRWAMEQGRTLSLEAVLELAWMMGLVVPDEEGAGFVDAKSGDRVADETLHERYERDILAHCGVRVVEPAVTGFDPRALPTLVEVRLERDFTFPVASRQVGQAVVDEDPAHSALFADEAGALFVVRKQGAVVKVPAAISVHRAVAGQLPTGWDATRFGVPKSLVEQVDPVTLYCLISTAEAFLAAGLTPEELLAHLHPSRVGVTIGTGIGGMAKLKRLHRDLFEGKERQNDTLQETLINVIGGYVVQAYLGSTGPMSFPVGACATGGLSLAEALDKLRTGQADLVVAGGADDLSEAGLIGFGDMGATADTDELAARGIEPAHMSRGSDTRRRGFVEAHGAGVAVLCRASLAIRLGLPVYGVLAFAGTCGDGLQKSVPAPGQGALSFCAEHRAAAQRSDPSACDLAGRRAQLDDLVKRRIELCALVGEAEAERIITDARVRLGHRFFEKREDISPLRGALAVLGLSANDVAVVSKHDSSTQANDVSEASLHETLMSALGRDDDHPLWVISQKALTGHPKGAAASWQVNGLLQAMGSSLIPPNHSLDDVSEEMRAFPRLVWTDRPVQLAKPMLAGLVTTLGFGHVSALLCLAHPFLFWRMLDDEQRSSYQARLTARLRRGEQRLQGVLCGRAPLFSQREPHLSPEHEARVLLDVTARLHREEHGPA